MTSGYTDAGFALATEAARAVLDTAFQCLELNEIVAFAVAENVRSIRVMEKIGMKRDLAGSFDHPLVENPQLRRHVLYRAAR